MKARTTAIASACLVLSLWASTLTIRHIDRIRPHAAFDDVLFLRSAKALRYASLGYDGLAACIYWTRTVQYFGRQFHDYGRDYHLLGPLLELTTQLDPHLIIAYQFGGYFLAPQPPGGAGEPDRGIKLMEFGIAHNPEEWRLYYNLGFIYYFDVKDYKKAYEAFNRGSEVPHAHPVMKILAARMAQQSRDYTTARILWTQTYESTNEQNIRRNALDHLRAIQVDEDIANLLAAVTRFHQNSGRFPSNMRELAAAEHFPGIPVDPDGHPYKVTPEGQVLVQNPDDFPFITAGTPGYKANPKARTPF